MHALREGLRQQEDDRRDGEHRQRKQPVDRKERDRRRQEQHDAVDQHADDVADRVAHHVEVTGQARHQVAGAVLREETAVLRLHVGIKLTAQLEKQLLRARFVCNNRQIVERGAEEREADQQRDEEHEAAPKRRRDAAALLHGRKNGVHDLRRQNGIDERHHRDENGGTQRENISLSAALQVFPNPFHLKHCVRTFLSNTNSVLPHTRPAEPRCFASVYYSGIVAKWKPFSQFSSRENLQTSPVKTAKKHKKAPRLSVQDMSTVHGHILQKTAGAKPS